ncbi:MAG TPA: pirin family protein [Caulobacteraceae bacterium]
MKSLVEILPPMGDHWVGDGLPVRTLFFYENLGAALSPFLLLDYARPYHFGPALRPRGVGPHPHRGFETVTLVYDGEVAHRDSTGQGGVIGPGDVQWMTAGAGIVHQEFHSEAFTRTGGTLQMAQLWVNLPAAEKMAPPAYQAITAADIPSAETAARRVRVIAGDFNGSKGPAKTFTPVNVWDVTLTGVAPTDLPAPEGHTTIVVVLSGSVSLGSGRSLSAGEAALMSRDGSGLALSSEGESRLLVLTGEPIDEPIVGRGPFVMNSEVEIRQAYFDYSQGRFGAPVPEPA